ncbi:Copine-9 [Pseudolycoriella hygida]|uniref:Copine-9 n=1 Tax=Pseudolycoriella hygida TaxID=35572 RepID=A0A9Q0N2G4_9DIPT|nr:Copine-9 [Pseudolycoriella hygida]
MNKVAWSPNASSKKFVTNEVLAPFMPQKVCTTKVEISMSCSNLLDLDIASKSDPYVVLSMKEKWQDDLSWKQIDRTETIYNSLNPQWAKKFIVDYKFETIQEMKFEVRDDDSGGKCGRFQYLGIFETILSDIVSHPRTQFVGKLTGAMGKNCGEIILVAEEVSACKKLVEVELKAANLKRQSWLKRNNPFLVVSRLNEDDSYSVVKRLGTIPTRNATWKLSIHLNSLCNGDYDRGIKIDCYNRRRDGNHKLIGTCETSLREIQVETLKLYKTRKQSTSNSIETGKLKILRFQITDEVSFMDYIRNGTQMHFAVAVDFTQSNKDYTSPESLHYLSANSLNPYQIALRSVGEIIQHYDNSHLYPAFGFGAKIPPNGEVSHQFPLNGNPKHPHCSSIDEILVHYENCLKTVELYGPTNFAPVINNAISIASAFQNGKHYFVLLIITDGIISDMKETKHAIISASSLPISIIIVGVGMANFNKMDQLDSDEWRLRIDGRFAERDIVQFVPLSKFLGKKKHTEIKSNADLARNVLAEIPYQFLSYMEKMGYKPRMGDQES